MNKCKLHFPLFYKYYVSVLTHHGLCSDPLRVEGVVPVLRVGERAGLGVQVRDGGGLAHARAQADVGRAGRGRRRLEGKESLVGGVGGGAERRNGKRWMVVFVACGVVKSEF